MAIPQLLLTLFLLHSATPALAAIYRCTDKNGGTTYSDTPCLPIPRSNKQADPQTRPENPYRTPARPSKTWQSAESLIQQGKATPYADERWRLFRTAARQICLAVREGMSPAQKRRAAELHTEFLSKTQNSHYADTGAQDAYLSTALASVASGTCYY